MCNEKLSKSKIIPIYIDWGEAPQTQMSMSDLQVIAKSQAELSLTNAKVRFLHTPNQQYERLQAEKIRSDQVYEETIEHLTEEQVQLNNALRNMAQRNKYLEQIIEKSEESILRLKRDYRTLKHDSKATDLKLRQSLSHSGSYNQSTKRACLDPGNHCQIDALQKTFQKEEPVLGMIGKLTFFILSFQCV